ACPTGALTPWQLDHEACLGYHNQMEGFIPEQYRQALGNRMFGCDTCQDVCPYNRAALSGLHPEFAPLEEPGAWLDLEALLAMTPEEFERQFAPTAAAWRGLETLQRNALVVLGNSGDAGAFEPLARALGSESPLLRGHAAWGIGELLSRPSEMDFEHALELLQKRLSTERDEDVRHELTRAIARLKESPCN
ncbi:MAG TPA: 4Fe-4S double cluster binding domain-containing protein, partial [Oscillatoriaceae cyanobacterium]